MNGIKDKYFYFFLFRPEDTPHKVTGIYNSVYCFLLLKSKNIIKTCSYNRI